MPSPEGHLILRLHRPSNAPVRVEIISSRPQLADRLFQGKTPAEAAELAGQVFTRCGRAQRLAAVAACAAAESNASGNVGHSSLFQSLQQAVMVETALEHAWRLWVDWPALVGLPPDINSLRELRQAAATGFAALADRLETMLETTLPTIPLLPTAFFKNESRFGSLLPPISKLNSAEIDLLAWQTLEEPAFCTRPLWRGQPAETGALARQQHHPLLADSFTAHEQRLVARWRARRLELIELPARLRREPTELLLAKPLMENRGYAWVETARGALLHVVRLEKGRVAAYRIIAPTEWNFHPAGPFVAGIVALDETVDLAATARALALSLDPCVSYHVEIVDA